VSDIRDFRLWGRLAGAAACLLAAVLMLPHVAGTLQHGIAMVNFGWQVDFDEGVVLHSAYLISHGHNPYPSLRADRFVSSTYPPIYYLLLAGWDRISVTSLGFGRGLSLAGSIMAAAAVSWLAFRSGGGMWSGIAAGALFLGNGLVWVWGSFQKPDALALALELVGVCLMASRSSSWRYLAIGPLVMAFFTKQSAMAGLAASAIYMLMVHRKGAIGWLSAAGGLLLAGYLSLEMVSGGNYSLHTVVFQAAIPWRWTQLGQQVHRLLSNNGALAVAGLLGWAISWRYCQLRLFSLYGLVAMVETLAVNGRSGVNHGLLLIALPALVIFASLMPRLLSSSGRVEGKVGVALAALLVLAAGTSAPGTAWYSMGRMPEVADAARYREMARLVAEQPGLALSENTQVLLAAGKEVLFDDTFMMGWAARSGLWDEAAFVTMLRERRFGVLLFEKDPSRLSPAAQSAIAEFYRLAYRDYLNIWLPRRD
jgi:hypothetical protein